ncbi:GntR family transcriptional regulator [Brachybacterium sp. YJGR34]|uniref:GntR family transcriptional regulator n=1 Tax=Brachybacterium sp. YJGR34 TaxID=2059911 RepID=UPI000E0BCC23|nr:GntR family transcriptional regulator [Brachybacterium sp. YJGR34]
MTATTRGAQTYREIVTFLRREISSGALVPGQSLPTEADLCTRFQTSRGPVRQALGILRDEGLISSGRGRRSVVLETVPVQPFDVALSFTQWCREMGAEPGQRTESLTREWATRAQADSLEIEEGDPIVDVLRLRFADGTPIMLERLCYPFEVGRHILSFDPDSGSIYERLVACGVDIHHATRILDAVAADAVDADLLGIEEGSPLMRLRRRAFTIEGHPIEWSDDRYLPSHARFASTTVRGAANGLSMLRGV